MRVAYNALRDISFDKFGKVTDVFRGFVPIQEKSTRFEKLAFRQIVVPIVEIDLFGTPYYMERRKLLNLPSYDFFWLPAVSTGYKHRFHILVV